MHQFFIPAHKPCRALGWQWTELGYTLNLHGQQALERQEDGLQTFHCRTVVKKYVKEGRMQGKLRPDRGEDQAPSLPHTLNGVIEWKAGVGKSQGLDNPTKE